MSEFDPTKPARVHDELNDRWFEWEPRWAPEFKNVPWSEENPQLVEWDGLLLDAGSHYPCTDQ
jgi:hypothetical protein